MLAACPSIYRTIIPHSVDRLDGAEWCKGKIQGFTLLYIFLTVISHVTLMCHVQFDGGYCNNMNSFPQMAILTAQQYQACLFTYACRLESLNSVKWLKSYRFFINGVTMG